MVKIPDYGSTGITSPLSNSGVSIDRPNMASAEFGAKADKYQVYASIANEVDRDFQQKYDAERKMRIASKTADLNRAAFELKNQFKDYQDFDQVRPGSKKTYEEKFAAPLVDSITDPLEKAAVFDAANRIGLDLEVDAQNYSSARKKDTALAKAEADLRHLSQSFVSASNNTARSMVRDNYKEYISGLVDAGYMDAEQAQLRYVKMNHDNAAALITDAVNAGNPLLAADYLEQNKDYLYPDDAARLGSAIKNANESQNAIRAGVFQNQFENNIIMAENGSPDPQYIEDYTEALRSSGQIAAADQATQTFQNAVIKGETKSLLAQASPDKFNEIIEASGADAKTKEQMKKYAFDVQKDRLDDPAGYVQVHFKNEAKTPEGMIAAQQHLGIPEYMQGLLNAPMAKQIKESLIAESDPTTLVKSMQSLFAQYPDQYGSYIYNDLRRAGLPEDYLVLALLPQDEPILLDAAAKAAKSFDKGYAEKYTNEDKKVYFDGVSESMDDYYKSWRSSGYSENEVFGINQALGKAAMVMNFHHESGADKSVAAMTKWVRDSYKFGSSNVSHVLRVPKAYGRSTIENRLTNSLDKLAGLGTNPRTAAYYGMDIPSVIAAGDMYWANTRDDKGVTLSYSGKPVPIVKDDKAFTLTLPFDMIQNATPDEDIVAKGIQMLMEQPVIAPLPAVNDNRPATAADVFLEE